jgi:hypothetical protein
MVRTMGRSADVQGIELLYKQGHEQITELIQPGRLNFEIEKELALRELFFNRINEIRLIGPELNSPVGTQMSVDV